MRKRFILVEIELAELKCISEEGPFRLEKICFNLKKDKTTHRDFVKVVHTRTEIYF